MMTTFRNNRQRAKACRILLRFQGLEHFWMAEDLGPSAGPTDEATVELAKVRSGSSLLSSSERLLLRVAFDFWNGAGFASIWDVQSYLNVNIIHAIAELLIAANENPQLTGSEVDKWLDDWKSFRVHTVSLAPPVG